MKKPMALCPLLLTGKQAAQMCGVSERTWRRWSQSGRAPGAIKMDAAQSGAVRYPYAKLLEWVAQGCPRCD